MVHGGALCYLQGISDHLLKIVLLLRGHREYGRRLVVPHLHVKITHVMRVTQSKEDLHVIIPELATKTVNNIFWDYASLEPPIIFLRKEKWPGDKWETDGSSTRIHLTMYVQFIYLLSLRSRDRLIGISSMKEFTSKPGDTHDCLTVPVDFEGDEQDMVLMEDIVPDPLVADAPSIAPGAPQIASTILSTTYSGEPGYWSNQYPAVPTSLWDPMRTSGYYSGQWPAHHTNPQVEYCYSPLPHGYEEPTPIAYPVSSLRSTVKLPPPASQHATRVEPNEIRGVETNISAEESLNAIPLSLPQPLSQAETQMESGSQPQPVVNVQETQTRQEKTEYMEHADGNALDLFSTMTSPPQMQPASGLRSRSTSVSSIPSPSSDESDRDQERETTPPTSVSFC